MKQKDRARKLTGEQGFEQYYSELFGERWPLLKKALLGKDSPLSYDAGGKDKYFLDSASVRAAASLPLSGAKSILDMCAAPGGKTVVIASCMDKDAALLSNERSADRKKRLVNTVKNCLPPQIAERVTVIGKDGATLCLAPSNRFDRILLDAPCSSERHVLQDPNYLKDWSPSRIKTLAGTQWALLSSAWRMLNEGGCMVYSTCALNPDENDNVIQKLIKKFDDVEVLTNEGDNEVSSTGDGLPVSDVSAFCNAELPLGEQTRFGRHVLPDASDGAGPLYYCVLSKKNPNSIENLSELCYI